MTVPASIRKEAARGGFTVWANVETEAMAKTIKARVLKQFPRSKASIGFLPDESFVVWYMNPVKAKPRSPTAPNPRRRKERLTQRELDRLFGRTPR